MFSIVDVNVNVNVRIGGGGDSGVHRRPQWFGDRPQKGGPDRGGRPHRGGQDYEDSSSEEDEYEEGGKPRPETNGSR